MDAEELTTWRAFLRSELIDRRLSINSEQRARWSKRIGDSLKALLAGVSGKVIGFCWPHQGEYDARPIVLHCIDSGARAALPVVVAPRQPLIFRQWDRETKMTAGVFDVPIPVDSPDLRPDILLIPLAGFDPQGYRLGYGAGYFDRTLGSMDEPKPKAIGIGFELARVPTIHPQWYDVPMDYVVTELGVHRRESAGLVRIAPAAQGNVPT